MSILKKLRSTFFNGENAPGFQDTDTRILMSSQNFGHGLDPNLIDNFKVARDRLRHMALFIQKQADTGDWETAERAIDKFRSKLTDHLLVETFKLYNNTKQLLKDNPELYQYVKNYGVEMGNVCNNLVQFIEAQDGLSSNIELQHTFAENWKMHCLQLVQRWEAEETELYPIYTELAYRSRQKSQDKA